MGLARQPAADKRALWRMSIRGVREAPAKKPALLQSGNNAQSKPKLGLFDG